MRIDTCTRSLRARSSSGASTPRAEPAATCRRTALATGTIPEGALVERSIKTSYAKKGRITLSLHQPSFLTAQRIVEALNQTLGKGSAKAVDGGAVSIKTPKDLRDKPVELLAKITALNIDPATHARVVINERTGTIVAGGDVRLLPAAIAQGGITITVSESRAVSQPNAPFIGGAAGETVEVPETEVETEEREAGLQYVSGAATLADVAQALSTLGVTPRELASILQALRAAGALRAEVIVQ